MDDKTPQKIGQGHLQAFIRQGFKEIGQVVPAFPNGSIHPVEEPGLFGNPTPQEIVQAKSVPSYEQALQSYAARSTAEPELSPLER